MKIELAHRIRELPPYLFARIDALKNEERKKGKDLIDLGIGDPDLPTPPHIVAALAEAARDPSTHRYPSYVGMESFRKAAATFMQTRFGLTFDPQKEVICVIGSKEAIAHFPFAFVNPGDVVLCPDPGYPVYATLTRFAGGEPYFMPLRRDNGFLIDLDAIPADVARRAKIMWINYPNNPTAALAAPGFYERVVAFAQKYDVIIASDLAYSEMYYETAAPLVPGDAGRARGRHRVPLAVEDLQHDGLARRLGVRERAAGRGAGPGEDQRRLRRVRGRAARGDRGADRRSGAGRPPARDLQANGATSCAAGLAAAGFDVLTPKASFYTLVANPKGLTSIEFAPAC